MEDTSRQYDPRFISKDAQDGIIAVVHSKMTLLARLKKDVLREGSDFRAAPGAKRPTLLRSGAELINQAFELRQGQTLIRRKELRNGHVHYMVRIRLVDGDGAQVSEGVGSASTMESKHRWWHGWEPIEPAEYDAESPCGTEKVLDPDDSHRGWWVCRLGEPANADNAVFKMAKERAYIDATITAVGASWHFSQDLEDLGTQAQGHDGGFAPNRRGGDGGRGPAAHNAP